MPPTGCAGRYGDADTKHAPYLPLPTTGRLATMKITNYGWILEGYMAGAGLHWAITRSVIASGLPSGHHRIESRSLAPIWRAPRARTWAPLSGP